VSHDTPSPAIPSATVAIVRNGPSGALEVLMVRRPVRATDKFSGKWVFPGGKVDDEDQLPGDDELAAARRAAVREVREEVALDLSHEALVALNRWEPESSGNGSRRFSAWVFVAETVQSEVIVDGVELHEHVWVTPEEALRRQAVGEIDLAPPTWHTLLGLAEQTSVAHALRWATDREPEHYSTRLMMVDSTAVLLWHGDVMRGGADHHRHRLWMIDGEWRYERILD